MTVHIWWWKRLLTPVCSTYSGVYLDLGFERDRDCASPLPFRRTAMLKVVFFSRYRVSITYSSSISSALPSKTSSTIAAAASASRPSSWSPSKCSPASRPSTKRT